MTRSVRFVLTVWYLAILTLILCLFSWTLYKKVGSNLDTEVNDYLVDQTEIISDTVFAFWQMDHRQNPTPSGGRHASIKQIASTQALPKLISKWATGTDELAKRSLRIVGVDGAVLAESPGFKQFNFPLMSEAVKAALKGKTHYQTFRQSGLRYRVVTCPIIEDKQVLYIIQASASLRQADASLQNLRNWLYGLVPFTLFVASAVGWFLASMAMKPVSLMIQKTRSITLKDLHERLEVPATGDEIEQLARTFNDLLMRLDKSFRRIRQFSAAAAHELRTPLSILRGELEVTLRKPRSNEEYQRLIQSQLEILKEMSGIVEELLSLAYNEEGEDALRMETIRINTLVGSMIPSWKEIAASKNVAMEFIENGALLVRCDQSLLERLVSNLLDNAVKHTPDGGKITVQLSRQDRDACLSVRDTGSGIREDELPKIFDKFFSKTSSRTSSGIGLGLGLCRWIAEAHKGRIDVATEAGRGATFTLRLPLSIPS